MPGLELGLRLVVSLALVLGLLWALAKVSSRRFNGSGSALMQVAQRQQVSRGSSISVVTVGSRVLLLGITEQQVSLITELDPEELLEWQTEQAAAKAAAAQKPPGIVAAKTGALSQSLLAPETWRQAYRVVRSGRRP